MLTYFHRFRIPFAFASAILALTLAGFLAFRSVIAAGQSASMVQHTYDVLIELDRLSQSVARIKTDSRTYALGGLLRDLSSENALNAEIHLQNIAALTKDNAEQQASLPLLRAAIDGVRHAAAKLLSGASQSIILDRTDIAKAEAAVARFDAIVAKFKGREFVLLQQRRQEAEKNQWESLTLLFVGMAVGLLITISAGLGTIRDMHRRARAEAQLHVEKELAQVTLSSIGDGVIRVDGSGCVTFLNQAAEMMTGWSEGEALGRPFASIFSMVDGTSGQRIRDRMQAAIEKGETLRLPENLALVRRDGTRIPIEDTVTPIRDRDGRVQGAVNVFRDATASRAILHSSQHDTLTGLPNRKLFQVCFQRAAEACAADNKRLAVLFLDLDGFKPINDRHGHAMGDLLLEGVAKRLRSCVRGNDVISRLSGDEFAVLLENIETPSDAGARAERILHRLSAAYAIKGNRLSVGASIGVAVFPDDATDFDTLLGNADSAMYRAKADGKNTYRLYSAEVIEVPARRA